MVDVPRLEVPPGRTLLPNGVELPNQDANSEKSEEASELEHTRETAAFQSHVENHKDDGQENNGDISDVPVISDEQHSEADQVESDFYSENEQEYKFDYL